MAVPCQSCSVLATLSVSLAPLSCSLCVLAYAALMARGPFPFVCIWGMFCLLLEPPYIPSRRLKAKTNLNLLSVRRTYS
uniref:Secreted peptide n=2 Tax=Cercopithecinae TaxID=9528 RepID=A0A2K5LRV8_CERAT